MKKKACDRVIPPDLAIGFGYLAHFLILIRKRSLRLALLEEGGKEKFR